MSSYVDENPDYWNDYNNLQRVKHELLRRYLGGWFPILASWSRRVLYVDSHAGRGQHSGGQLGSPVVALTTLLEHPHRAAILKTAEVHFVFIEADEQNRRALEENLARYPRPRNVFVDVKCEDFSQVLQEAIDQLHAQKSDMAPAFVFVDPYGFSLPGRLLAQLASFQRCELFITFMWRWIDMALRNPALVPNMDSLFVSGNWRDLTKISDADGRCEAAIRLLKEQLHANYLTRVKMLGEHSEIKYVLIHATNHPKGRELMQDAVWKICPSGGFRVRINDNPNQEYLIKPEPDLAPLEQWLSARYLNKNVAINRIYEGMNDESEGTFYLKKHVHAVLRKMHADGLIRGPAKLVFSQNPVISFLGTNPTRPGKSG